MTDNSDSVTPLCGVTVCSSGISLADVHNNDSDVNSLSSDYLCNLYDFAIEAVVMGALCAFGFVGNTLSSICLWRDKSKSATPFLLVSLELFDTFFLTTVLLLSVITSINTFSPNILITIPQLKPYLAKYVYPCALIAETGTIYMTVLVTLNRYIAVCHPYDAMNLGSVANARIHVVVVTTFSILFNIPRFFEYDVTTLLDGENDSDSGTSASSTSCVTDSEQEGKVQYVVGSEDIGRCLDGSKPWMNVTFVQAEPTWLLQNNVYQIVYLNLLYFVVMFFVPLVSLVLLNWRLMTTLRLTRTRRESMRRGSSVISTASGRVGGKASAGSSRSEDDITRMLVVVVVVFVVTQSPALATQVLANVLRRYDEESLTCGHPYFYYARISDLLVVLNSSINFLIYCLCSRRFRQSLVDILYQRCMTSSPRTSRLERRDTDVTSVGLGQLGGTNGSSFRRGGSSLRRPAAALVAAACEAGGAIVAVAGVGVGGEKSEEGGANVTLVRMETDVDVNHHNHINNLV